MPDFRAATQHKNPRSALLDPCCARDLGAFLFDSRWASPPRAPPAWRALVWIVPGFSTSWSRCRIKILQRLSFRQESSNQGHFSLENISVFGVKGIAKLALPSLQRLKCGRFSFARTKRSEFQKDGFSAVRFHASSIAFSG